MKVLQTTMMKMPAVCGHNMGVPPATPVQSIEEYFDYLFHRHGTLETPVIPTPKRSIITSGLKDR